MNDAYWTKDTPAEQVGQRSHERVIYGYGPEPVVMVKAPLVTPSCGPGKHCAAHCESPHPCCRCGAAFKADMQYYANKIHDAASKNTRGF